MKKIKVLHVITRSVAGGAPENTFLTMQGADATGRYQSALACQPGGPLAVKTRASGFQVFPVYWMRKEVKPLHEILAFWQLYRIMRRERFFIVHTHASKAGILGRLAAKLAGVPVIIHTIHGFGFNDYQTPAVRSLYVWLERICARFCDKLVTVSRLNIPKALFYGIGENDQYMTVHSGIDREKFKPLPVNRKEKMEQLGLNHRAPLISMFGHLDKGKGHQFLLAAAKKVLKKHPEVQFIIVGDGKLEDKVRKWVKEMNLADNVLVTGYRDDVPELLSITDISTLPTLWEGLPRVVPEAMAMGKPVVATCVDGIPEAVIDGKTGLLVPPADSEALADALLKLLEDKEMALRMGEEGRKVVFPTFCSQEMVKELVALYDEMVERKKRI